MPVSIALIHYPVKDKVGHVAATSITNFDIHDLARSARTYDVYRYYIVSPMARQQEFAGRVIRHWKEGFGSQYNPSRGNALEIARIIDDLSQVVDDLGGESPPIFVGTSARWAPHTISYRDMRKRIEEKDEQICLVFGTGWGLHPSLQAELDLMLEPIEGVGPYNHLSVRSAVAIILDRLLGKRMDA